MSKPIYGREFDCVECGQHIVQAVGYEGTPELCALCMTLPGWFTDPELARIHGYEPPEKEA